MFTCRCVPKLSTPVVSLTISGLKAQLFIPRRPMATITDCTVQNLASTFLNSIIFCTVCFFSSVEAILWLRELVVGLSCGRLGCIPQQSTWMWVGPSDNEEVSCTQVSVQYVFFLSHCYLLYAFCLCYILIALFFSFIPFLFIFLFCMFCFLFCVFCVFVLFCLLFLIMYIVVYFLYVNSFTNHCHRVDIQLQSINIKSSYHISYHIISYHIISHHICHIISCHIISYHVISYHIISYHIISYHIRVFQLSPQYYPTFSPHSQSIHLPPTLQYNISK